MGLCIAQLCPGFLLEDSTYDEYENDLGITAVALYDYQAGERPAKVFRGETRAAAPACACFLRIDFSSVVSLEIIHVEIISEV